MAKPSAKRAATASDLLCKPARTKDVTVVLGGDEAVVTVKAIGSRAYDDMLSAHPPTREQRKDGGTYNIDTFAPQLLSECLVSPELTLEQATELWGSPEWSRGELLDLFFAAVEVNNKGLDVPFNESA